MMNLTSLITHGLAAQESTGNPLAKRWQSEFTVTTYPKPWCKGRNLGREFTGWRAPVCTEMGHALSFRVQLNHNIHCPAIIVSYYENAKCPDGEKAMRQVMYEMDGRVYCINIPHDFAAHYSAWLECWSTPKPPQVQMSNGEGVILQDD